MMWAFLNRQREESAMQSSPALTEAWNLWAEPVRRLTGGTIGVVPGDVYHLFHGAYGNRRYVERTQAKADYHFQPGIDTRIDELGLYAWTGANPALEAFVRNYFPSRKDDGDDVHSRNSAAASADAHQSL